MNYFFKFCGFVLFLFFVGCAPQKRAVPRVDEALAWKEVNSIVKMGPRPSGSLALKKQAEYILSQAKKYGGKNCKIQSFTKNTPFGKVEFHNVVVEIPGDSSDFIVLGSHFDTKQLKLSPRFVGANDGGSSTGLLLAMIKAMAGAGSKPPFTIRCLFFDGEECMVDYGINDGLFGSKYYVQSLVADGEISRCKGCIVLDMIGDKDLHISLPTGTDKKLREALFDIAKKRDLASTFSMFKTDVIDDHTPFQERGIPVMDVIDFEYGPNNSYWHTEEDTMDKLSPKSLKCVGDVILELLWNYKI